MILRIPTPSQGNGGKLISAFRCELEATNLVSHFRSPDHLAGLVSVALTRCLMENPPPGRSPRPLIKEVKCRALEQRLDALLQEFQAATQELSYIRDAVDTIKLKRRIEAIESEIAEVEGELDALGFGGRHVR